MGVVAEIKSATALAVGLRSFLRERVSAAQARDLIRQRLDRREDNFLEMAQAAIFGVAASPYRMLLQMAGCSFADLRTSVRTRGVEATMRQLCNEGVYVTFEEFKGRKPIVRHGKAIHTSPGDFYNPLRSAHYWVESGGSTGSALRVSTDLNRVAVSASYLAVAYEAYGFAGAPKALWRGLLPASAGLNFLLACSRTGDVPERWFTPLAGRELMSSRKYPAATYAILALGRMNGVALPWPEHVPPAGARAIAEWARQKVTAKGRCYISTSASMALRACLAARDAGIDLSGVMFSGGGEPMTDAKAKGIADAGAQCRPSYFTTEAGAIGVSCANPADANDQHFLADSSVLIQRRRAVPGSSQMVDAFCVSSLLPSASCVMLNVELDDYGLMETRRCGCPFEELGLTRHLRHIRSFRKLTGEGVTLVGSDMERVLGEILPARFGGSALDYQLLEDENEQGLTRLHLIVSPHLEIADEQTVIATVLHSLTAQGAGADHARATWQQTRTLDVIRREPTWTDQGKLQPLHLSRRHHPTNAGASEDTGDAGSTSSRDTV
jgi:hypothetical protein